MSEKIINAQYRDINTITGEIRFITRQTQEVVVRAAIEIGRRLSEAKALLPHGEWGEWLKNEVEFSQSTANNFMKMFEEYGSEQQSLFGNISNSQAFANLPYTKALKLLAIPADEREEFAAENKVDQLSTREIDRLIKERKAAEDKAAAAESKALSADQKAVIAAKAAQAAEDRAEKAEKAKSDVVSRLEKEMELRKKVSSELEELKTNPTIPVDTLTKLAADAEAKASKEYEAKLNEASAAVGAAEDQIRNLQKQLAVSNPHIAEFNFHFKQMQETLSKMNNKLQDIWATDTATASKLAAGVKTVLERMASELA